MNETKQVILLCHSTTEDLAERISSLSKSDASSTKIVFRRDILWNKFPDDFPNLFIQNLDQCVGKNVVFLGSFHTPKVVFEQISLIYTLPRSSIRSLTFILPYFPTGTMERIDTEGQVATAMTMARMLSAIPLSAMGPAKIMIFDIHALQERFFFSDNVLPQLCTAIPRFLEELHSLRSVTDDSITIAFPDEGAHKRFHPHFSDFPVIRCIKTRHGQKREITIVDGNPRGQHVVIVDDLIMTGGTIQKCVNTLLDAGAAKVSAYVTHPVFPLESWKQFTTDRGSSEAKTLWRFWITDSIPHASGIAQHSPFKLLSLASSIKDAMENCSFW